MFQLIRTPLSPEGKNKHNDQQKKERLSTSVGERCEALADVESRSQWENNVKQNLERIAYQTNGLSNRSNHVSGKTICIWSNCCPGNRLNLYVI